GGPGAAGAQQLSPRPRPAGARALPGFPLRRSGIARVVSAVVGSHAVAATWVGMSQSFTPQETLAESSRKRRRVLVTGAAGNIGSYFAEHSRHRYDLRLMVRENDDPPDVQRIG